MKKWLCKLAYKVLEKYDTVHIKRCYVGEKINIDTKSYIPDDGKWHFVSLSVGYHIKLNKGRKRTKKEHKFYIDGVQVYNIKKT